MAVILGFTVSTMKPAGCMGVVHIGRCTVAPFSLELRMVGLASFGGCEAGV